MQGFGEDVVVDEASVDREQTHEEDDVTTAVQPSASALSHRKGRVTHKKKVPKISP